MRRLLCLITFCVALFISCYAYALTDNEDGTVSDADNSLMWIERPFTAKSWTAATSHASSYSFAGQSDWRLPTLTELQTLIVSTNTPKIDLLIDLGPPANWSIWSSTEITVPSSIFPDQAYLLFFDNGRSFYQSKLSHHAALYVRALAFDYLMFTADPILFGADSLYF